MLYFVKIEILDINRCIDNVAMFKPFVSVYMIIHFLTYVYSRIFLKETNTNNVSTCIVDLIHVNTRMDEPETSWLQGPIKTCLILGTIDLVCTH